MKLPNKIQNLNLLKKTVKIPTFTYISNKSFFSDQKKIVKNLQIKFKKNIIIRSASFEEDGDKSNAGKYLSVSNVDISNFKKVVNAINDVFNSYKSDSGIQFVLIQEYIKNANSVGVIFTGDSKNGSPFRTVNFNNTSHTELITSGKSNGQIIYYFKDLLNLKLSKQIQNLNNVIKKIEKKFPSIFLDIEFLILNKQIYILQVRKLNTKKKSKINFKKSLKDLEKKLSKMTNETSHLIGYHRYFSTMTDWNPAEIIGLKPKTLALSLYQTLITNEIWSSSRVELGYNDVTKMPLMYSFLGTPYIDLKTDINSFLISNLSDKIKKKLVKFYFKKFKEKPHFYYDKIESDLVINCISLDIKKYKNILSESNLSKKEINIIIKAYISLTSNLIFQLGTNIDKYKYGESLFYKLKKSKNSTINKIYLLHNICKSYGTLPFANLARMAFVAVEFLNSFEKLKIISASDKKVFLETIKSVSSEMSNSLKISKKYFIKRYGHLRPNTYEISTPNYKENYNNYFQKIQPLSKKQKKYKFNKKQKIEIDKYLKNNHFNNINADILINFIENSIYERENSKLFFTKIIDEIFNQLKTLSKRIKLNHKDMQHLDIQKILDLYEKFSHENIAGELKKNIINNKKSYDFNQHFNLPNIILDKKDIYFYEEEQASPTFITDKIISSKFINVKKITKKLDIDNKIICIENADPGYDFIFNHKINGLITAFGGPNSHMSIRCNEFSVPAAIGIGEKKFQQLLNKNSVYLNCKKKMLSGI